MDLAVIAVPIGDVNSSTLQEIAVATLGNSDTLTVGEPAIAIGNSLGYGQSVTTGVISALNRSIQLSDGTDGTFIQTDAAINPGNSGGRAKWSASIPIKSAAAPWKAWDTRFLSRRQARSLQN